MSDQVDFKKRISVLCSEIVDSEFKYTTRVVCYDDSETNITDIFETNCNSPYDGALFALAAGLGYSVIEENTEVEELREQLCWRLEDDGLPIDEGEYLIEFYLDQGMGHGHNEMMVCEHDGDRILPPKFDGVGIPSIIRWSYYLHLIYFKWFAKRLK
jgi:hypothetical protein